MKQGWLQKANINSSLSVSMRVSHPGARPAIQQRRCGEAVQYVTSLPVTAHHVSSSKWERFSILSIMVLGSSHQILPPSSVCNY